MIRKRLVLHVLLCLVAASLIAASAFVCDDEDSSLDVLCNIGISFLFADLFFDILFLSGIFFWTEEAGCPRASIMSFLERLEKSPPRLILGACTG